MTKLSSAPARCRELPGSLTMLLPSSVAVPERCEIACCSTPISPTALMMPATHASANAPYSTHLGNLLNWPPRAAKNLQTAKLCKSRYRSEEHTSELQSRENLVCRLL